MASSPAPSPGLSAVTRSLVLVVAAIGFLFDTYELLMFPVTGAAAIAELLHVPVESDQIRLWSGRMLWIAALSGGVFGLLGGWLIDRLGRKTVMVGSILLYSLSPVAAALSTELWMLILFRCTTFIGVCVEAVAAVTWLAELFTEKRSRELAIGWTLAFASVGGIAVTEVYNGIVEVLKHNPEALPRLPVPESFDGHAAWRYTLLTGLVPGALILILMPFVPESRVWAERKRSGTLRRPSFGELFAPDLLRTTVVTTGLSACAYAAAFGALQLGPLVMVPGLPAIDAVKQEAAVRVKAAQEQVTATQPGTPERKAAEEELDRAKGLVAQAIKEKRGNIQRWQEIGGLTGRILLAALLIFVPSRLLIKLFILPAMVMYPVTYLRLFDADYTAFATAVFFCGLLTVAQFSFISEYLPKVFPVHLRGTGGGFATNFGGRMLGTMAALLNTEVLAPLFEGDNPTKVATAAAVIGGSVYALALVLSFLMPRPHEEGPPAGTPGQPPVAG